MKLLTGGTAKTTNLQIEYAWPCGPDSFNRRLAREIGMWIAKNEKQLNKKVVHDAVQVLMDEFPDLSYVEVKDYQFGLAKGGR